MNVLDLSRIPMLLAVLAALAVAAAPSPSLAQAADDFRVVVNPANPVSSVSAEQLSRFFLRRANSWDDGQQVQPVDQPARAPVRDTFSEAVLGRAARAIVAHWQQQIFSGRGVPPTELAGDAEVVEYVQRHPGAVGYVSGQADVTDVKVLEVTR